MTDEPPSCDVLIEAPWDDVTIDVDVLARDCAAAVLAGVAWPPGARVEISFRFTDDATIAELNGAWRGRPAATDVLAFPATAEAPTPATTDAPTVLGDVVVALETARADARTLDRPFADHLRHLLVHGLLHLFHHDHVTPTDAALMEALEVSVLDDLGVPDPYAGRPLLEETS